MPAILAAHAPAPSAHALRRLVDGEDVDHERLAAAVRPRLVTRESA